MIPLSLAMTAVTALILLARWSATTEQVTKSAWPRARNGSAAATWMGEWVLLLDTWSAWNGFLRLRGSMAAIQTQRRRLISQTTRGIVRQKKAVRLIHCR